VSFPESPARFEEMDSVLEKDQSNKDDIRNLEPFNTVINNYAIKCVWKYAFTVRMSTTKMGTCRLGRDYTRFTLLVA
jgi:hypothetical protein